VSDDENDEGNEPEISPMTIDEAMADPELWAQCAVEVDEDGREWVVAS
jgi:hypothetical protein